jgi:predicted nuclease of predicted toxin-antitoxin system
MRFLADMGVSLRVVDWLRLEGHDAVHLRDDGLQKLPDDDIFKKAVAEARIVLTFDLDFGEILALSAGAVVSVVLFRLSDATPDHVISRLEAVLAESTNELLSGAIIVVEESRHRIRKLPIGR